MRLKVPIVETRDHSANLLRARYNLDDVPEVAMQSTRCVAMIALVILVSFVLPAQEAPRRALVVGNGEYEHFGELRNPQNDAIDVAASLRELGFEVTTVLNADHRTLFGRIRDFGDELAREPGVGLFYYAGHAIEVDGTNYLIPTDADIRAQDEVEFASVPLNLVLSKMESAANPTNVIVLDACRDNPLPATARSAGAGRGLTVVQAPPGSLIVYATEPGSTADDGQGRNSPFTTAFLSHVATPGLDIELMFRNVRREVIESTSGRQIPWTNSSLTNS
ncbi:MAG: caspase family protein, partial [Spirochaetota bacterium]